jgi:hypothetical protein
VGLVTIESKSLPGFSMLHTDLSPMLPVLFGFGRCFIKLSSSIPSSKSANVSSSIV